MFSTQILLPHRKMFLLSILVMSLLVLTAAPLQGHIAQAGGNNIIVNSLSDNATTCAGSGIQCLRNAINTANGYSFLTRITFSVSGTIALTSALPVITSGYGVTIDGSGTNIYIDGGNSVPIFAVNSGGVSTLNSVTLQHGSAPFGSGAAAYNIGTLTITNSTLQFNAVGASGGGVYNVGTLTIANSSLNHNSAPGGVGGGIDNDNGTVTISGSTFYGNTVGAACGGGIENAGNSAYVTISNSTFASNATTSGTGCGGAISNYNGASMLISNSTFSGNSAYYGGAVHNQGNSLTIGNSTFSANSGNQGAGLYNFTGSALNLISSISAANTLTGSSPSGPDAFGAINSLGTNLIGDGTASTGFSNSYGDQVGTSGTPINPQLGLLQYNGGSTQTMGVLETSPALQKGYCGGATNVTPNAPGIHTDQRGNARKAVYVETGCDLGAFELPNEDSIGVYRNGTFLLRYHNTTGYADLSVNFHPGGNPYPVVGDWIGLNYDLVGVFDRSNGNFTLCTYNDTTQCANANHIISFTLGTANDTPLAGRWVLGAFHSGAGVYRPSNGILYLKNALSTGFADYGMVMGIPGDQGVAGDWTDKGYDSPGIFRPGSSTFYLSNQVTNGVVFADISVTYGNSTDLPITGDWVQQSHDGVGMFRSSNGFAYLKDALTTGYADTSFFYGTAGDIPVAGHWEAIYGHVPPISPQHAAPTILVTKAPSSGQSPSASVPGDNRIGS